MKADVVPTQNVVSPTMLTAVGTGLTMIVVAAKQPVGNVYDITAVPTPTLNTTPVVRIGMATL